MSDLKKKRVISVAITGSWPTREDNPKSINNTAGDCG